MKKTYTKPEIVFESFVLSTNIAGDCEAKAQTFANYSESGCGYLLGTNIIFGTDLTGCKGDDNYRQVEPNTGWNSICYHVPSEANNIFNS